MSEMLKRYAVIVNKGMSEPSSLLDECLSYDTEQLSVKALSMKLKQYQRVGKKVYDYCIYDIVSDKIIFTNAYVTAMIGTLTN